MLCWQRDAFLIHELRQLVGDSHDPARRPSLLECCWLASTPLALLVQHQALSACLRLTSLPALVACDIDMPPNSRVEAEGSRAAEGAAAAHSRATRRDLLLVISGELLKHSHPVRCTLHRRKGGLVTLARMLSLAYVRALTPVLRALRSSCVSSTTPPAGWRENTTVRRVAS